MFEEVNRSRLFVGLSRNALPKDVHPIVPIFQVVTYYFHVSLDVFENVER